MARGNLPIRKAPEPLDSRAIGAAADRSGNDLIYDSCVPPVCGHTPRRSELCCSYNQEIHDQISTEIGNNDTMAGLSRSLELEALLQAGHPDATLAGTSTGTTLRTGRNLTQQAGRNRRSSPQVGFMVNGDDQPDPPYEFEGAEAQYEVVAIGDRGRINEICHDILNKFQEASLKHVLKHWISTFHPKKQGENPYKGGESTKPPWWPPNVSHAEPDRLHKPERLKLAMHMLMKIGMSSDDLRRSTLGVGNKCESWVPPMLEDLYDIVDKLERHQRGEIDDDMTFPVQIRAKPKSKRRVRPGLSQTRRRVISRRWGSRRWLGPRRRTNPSPPAAAPASSGNDLNLISDEALSAQILHSTQMLNQHLSQIPHRNQMLDQHLSQIPHRNQMLDQHLSQILHSTQMLNQHLSGNEIVPLQHSVAGGVASEEQPFPFPLPVPAALGIDRLSMASHSQGAYNPMESAFSLNASNSNQPQERGITEWDQSVPPDGTWVPMSYFRDG